MERWKFVLRSDDRSDDSWSILAYIKSARWRDRPVPLIKENCFVDFNSTEKFQLFPGKYSLTLQGFIVSAFAQLIKSELPRARRGTLLLLL